jgi:hypothetical protein
MPPLPPELLGPFALTVALTFAVVLLWRDHLRADADDRAQRDRALELLPSILQALRDLTDAQKAANIDAAERHRRSDT